MTVRNALEDGRFERRSRAGIGAGAGCGAALGLVLALVLPAVHGLLPVFLVVVVGGAVGAMLGRSMATRINDVDWEPEGSPRPYVGAHTPDADLTQSSVNTRDTTPEGRAPAPDEHLYP